MIRLSIADRTAGLRGDVTLPASKSISNRALLLSSLCADGPAPIANLADCEDTRVMQAAFLPSSIIDVRGAGTAMRFLTAFYAGREGADVILTGIERMRQRPIAPLVDALRALGADITYMEREGCPPLHIRGRRLRGDGIDINGSISSQYVSALLMIAPLTGAHRLTLTGRIVSRPYIEMTRALMAHYGIGTAWEDDHTLRIAAGTYRAAPLTVEGDWSAASYWLAFEALARQQAIPYDVTLHGLQTPSLQGDSVCVELLGRADLPSSIFHLPSVNFSDCPDLVQTMAVAYCLMGRPFVFTGTESLRIKETDRIAALMTELAKLGYELTYEDGTLRWDGRQTSDIRHQTPDIATYNDHRMAMSFALAAMKRDSILINHPEVVSKSYPGFWDDLRNVGFNIEEL